MSTQRWKAQIAVAFLARSQRAVHLTESVTADGVFVRTDAPPPPMALVRVEFVLPPDDTRLVVHGMIANTVRSTSPHAVPGVEVVFFARSADATVRWTRFMRYLSEKHPEAVDRSVLLTREAAGPTLRHAFVDDFSSADVMPGGMFLATKQRFAVGTDLRVTLVNPSSPEKRTVDCVVRRSITGTETGIGVEYRNMTSETWADLATFLRKHEEPRALRAELHTVWTPHVPMIMQTLPGPWSNAVRPAAGDRPWSLPPEDGWFDSSELAGSPGE